MNIFFIIEQLFQKLKDLVFCDQREIKKLILQSILSLQTTELQWLLQIRDSQMVKLVLNLLKQEKKQAYLFEKQSKMKRGGDNFNQIMKNQGNFSKQFLQKVQPYYQILIDNIYISNSQNLILSLSQQLINNRYLIYQLFSNLSSNQAINEFLQNKTLLNTIKTSSGQNISSIIIDIFQQNILYYFKQNEKRHIKLEQIQLFQLNPFDKIQLTDKQYICKILCCSSQKVKQIIKQISYLFQNHQVEQINQIFMKIPLTLGYHIITLFNSRLLLKKKMKTIKKNTFKRKKNQIQQLNWSFTQKVESTTTQEIEKDQNQKQLINNNLWMPYQIFTQQTNYPEFNFFQNVLQNIDNQIKSKGKKKIKLRKPKLKNVLSKQIYKKMINQFMQKQIKVISEQSNSIKLQKVCLWKKIQQLASNINIIQIILFGSCVTGLSLINSDIDILFITLQPNQIQQLAQFEQIVKKQSWCISTKIIKKAIIPILKIECDMWKFSGKVNYKVMIDITITKINLINKAQQQKLNLALQTTFYTIQMLKKFPSLSHIVILIKHMIKAAHFHKTYEGGLNSYCLFIMILSYIKKFNYGNRKDYGILLQKIFHFYLYQFNQEKQKIDICNPQQELIIRLFVNKDYMQYTSQCLEIIGPFKGKSITGSCTKYQDIKKLFKQYLNITIKLKHLIDNQIGKLSKNQILKYSKQRQFILQSTSQISNIITQLDSLFKQKI